MRAVVNKSSSSLLDRVSERVLKYSFVLALLFHVLLLLLIPYLFLINKSESKPEPQKSDYIPSYAYHESKSAAYEEPQKPKPKIDEEKPKQKVETSPIGIKKPEFNEEEVKFNQSVDISPKKSDEPVHLIGDLDKTPKPLIILLGKALTSKLLYPKSAVDLKIGGVSVIGFVLFPDGHVEDVSLLQTSGASVLDNAAVLAARQISPVANAAKHVTKPTPIVFGIIFGRPN